MASLTPRLDKVESGNNLIINGNMDFSQRYGSSRAASAPDYFMTDRFKYYAAGGTAQFDWSTDVPTLAQSGFQSSKSLKLTVGTTTTSLYTIRYAMEGYDYAHIHGRAARLQFWVKSSIAGLYSVNFANQNTTRGYTATYTINSANTWEKKYIDLTMDSAGTWLFDNTAGLYIAWHLSQNGGVTSPANNQWNTTTNWNAAAGQVQLSNTGSATFQLAQVMMVQGDFSRASGADLMFQRAGKTIQQELALCLRYCWVDGANDSINGSYHTFATSSQAISGTVTENKLRFMVPMRAAPTMTLATNTAPYTGVASNYMSVNNVDSSSSALNALALSAATTEQAIMTGTCAVNTLTAGNASNLTRNNGNTTATIIWEADNM